MRIKVLSFSLILGTVIALIGFCRYGRQAEQTLARASDLAKKEKVRLLQELATVEKQEQEIAKRKGELAAELAALKAMPPPPVPGSAKKKGPISGAALHAANPELANLWLASLRARFKQDIGLFVQRTHLAPEKVEQLLAIESRRHERGLDLTAAALAQNLEFDDPLIKKLEQKSDADAKAEVEQLLGPEEARQFDDYQRAWAARGFVNSLAGLVAFTDPLRPSQAQQFAQILANASASYRQGKGANMKEVDWVAIDAQAKLLLSPAQFDIWRQGAARDASGRSRADNELERLYERAVEADKASAAVTETEGSTTSQPQERSD